MKALRPSSWGLKLIDTLFIILLVCIAIRVLAPTSGAASFIHAISHYIAIGVSYIANVIVTLLNLL